MFKSILVSSLVLAGISSAHAALPTEALAPLTTAGADAATLGGAVLVLIIAIMAWKHLRRAP